VRLRICNGRFTSHVNGMTNDDQNSVAVIVQKISLTLADELNTSILCFAVLSITNSILTSRPFYGNLLVCNKNFKSIIIDYTGLFTRGVLLNFYFGATNNTNGSNY
jgi:hypothetical protein